MNARYSARVESESSAKWPFPRTSTIDAVALLHVLRGTILLGSAIVYQEYAAVAIAFASVEFFVGFWFWKQRLESWGIALGLAVSHLPFPWSFYIPLGVIAALIMSTIVQGLLQFLVRSEGHYSFLSISEVQPNRSCEATFLQRAFFNMAILAQF